VNEVLTLHMGPEYILVNVSLDFSDQCTVESIEDAVDKLDHAIKKDWPLVKKVFVEAEAEEDHRS